MYDQNVFIIENYTTHNKVLQKYMSIMSNIELPMKQRKIIEVIIGVMISKKSVASNQTFTHRLVTRNLYTKTT